MAAMHLIDLGHKKIGGIFKIDDIQGHKRFAGFQKAQLESGIKCSDSSVLWYDTDDVEMKISIEDRMLNNLLAECTAIVCYNDQIGLKIIELTKQKGLKIPEQISIVSFDDSQLALASEVKLTTIAHPKEALGREAANAMLAIINKTINNYYKKMEPKLIVRESTKKYQEV
jgi:Transcriptional regulators